MGDHLNCGTPAGKSTYPSLSDKATSLQKKKDNIRACVDYRVTRASQNPCLHLPPPKLHTKQTMYFQFINFTIIQISLVASLPRKPCTKRKTKRIIEDAAPPNVGTKVACVEPSSEMIATVSRFLISA